MDPPLIAEGLPKYMTLIWSLHRGGTRMQRTSIISFWNLSTSILDRTARASLRFYFLLPPSSLHSLHTHAKSSAINSSSILIKLSRNGRRPSLYALMTSTVQTRLHGGHSHSHSHQHDNTYLTSTNKKDAGVRITRIGLYVNLVMAIGKGIGGYYFNSQALVADAFHALTDLVSDFMTLGTVSWSLKPPTQRFPSGYGKIESLGSLGVSSLLLVGGILMGLNACEVLYHEFFVDAAVATANAHGHSHGFFSHSHSHSADLGPNINAAWLAAGSIIVKEYLYRATMKIAKERKSTVLASNAVHHRIDSLTSIVALVAIGGSHIFTGTTWLDPIGGLLVSLMVIRAGWGNAEAALLELADVGVDDEVKTSVRQAATNALEIGNFASQSEYISVRDVQGVKAGQNYLIDIELVVPGSCTVDEARRTEELVRAKVGSTVRGVRKVKIRFVPRAHDKPSFADEFIWLDQRSLEPGKETEHGHDHHDHDNSSSVVKTEEDRKTQ